jgi:hypothetical protein
MSDVMEAPPRKKSGPSPAWFLYAAACAILLFGIIEAATINSDPSCEAPYYASGGTCVSYLSNGDPSIIGSTPPTATETPTRDLKLEVRAEIILASLTIALIVASYGARAHRREQAATLVEPKGSAGA